MAGGYFGTHFDFQTGFLATAIPIAFYLATLWGIRDRLHLDGTGRWLLLRVSGLVLMIAMFLPMALERIAALLVVTALARRKLSRTIG